MQNCKRFNVDYTSFCLVAVPVKEVRVFLINLTTSDANLATKRSLKPSQKEIIPCQVVGEVEDQEPETNALYNFQDVLYVHSIEILQKLVSISKEFEEYCIYITMHQINSRQLRNLC